MSQIKTNTPTASILINSMRFMGYTFESAIADIVDNSISAKCNRIDIRFPVNPQEPCFIAICDNGLGMTKEELFDAMKYGSELKGKHRENYDLGRFGLGLKSASLSQCRKLTDISKKNGILSAYKWDLDIIEETNNWNIIEYDLEEINNNDFSKYLPSLQSGTVVLWECFDILKKNVGCVFEELSKFFEPRQIYTLFRDIPIIFQTHSSLLNKMQAQNPSYSSCFGGI